jgi:hypothetical protein
MENPGTSGTVSAAFTEAESRLVGEIGAWLMSHRPDEGRALAESFSRLRALGDSVFAYPSIRDTRSLRGEIYDESRLVDSLLEFSSSSQMLRTPTKVVAMRSFLVAKFHAFSMLSTLTADLREYKVEIWRTVFSVISTLIAEAVYFSCMDDSNFSRRTKASLASDLIALWDSGVDHRGLRHLSALSSLWAARNSIRPNFGTMNGNVELLRLTIDLDDDWRDFLVDESENDQTRWAIEEFLFGLSWEEIRSVRAHLESRGIDAVGLDGIREYLHAPPAFTGINEADPRTFYDFFIERRDACNLRKKLGAPGPLYTLEEIYLKYRIVMEIR